MRRFEATFAGRAIRYACGVTRGNASALTLTLFCLTLMAFAPAALAQGAGENGGGQGWYGETSDKVITNAMFLVIAFFPTVIVVFSLIQWRLDKRKHARMDAAKRRAASTRVARRLVAPPRLRAGIPDPEHGTVAARPARSGRSPRCAPRGPNPRSFVASSSSTWKIPALPDIDDLHPDGPVAPAEILTSSIA